MKSNKFVCQKIPNKHKKFTYYCYVQVIESKIVYTYFQKEEIESKSENINEKEKGNLDRIWSGISSESEVFVNKKRPECYKYKTQRSSVNIMYFEVFGEEKEKKDIN